nr:NADH dehydrogenase subunit 2 [Stegastes partitus]
MGPFILSFMIFCLTLGTLLTVTSSHWFLAWVGLEINTLAVLPLMSVSFHPRATEAASKYFLVQGTGAALLLYAASADAWYTGDWHIQHMTHPFYLGMITLALALKLGLAPAHAWIPDILQGLDYPTGLILSTWQKIAPFSLLLQIPATNWTMLIALGAYSIMVGGWGGINQTELRKILAYSSIAHMGWMILIMKYYPSLSLLVLVMYMITTSSAFMALKLLKAKSTIALTMTKTKAPAISFITPFILLSLAGLPPLAGFAPKWLALQELAKQGLAIPATVAALSALLSLAFYLRLCFSTFFTTPPSLNDAGTPWRIIPPIQVTLPLALMTIATLCLLPLTPGMLAYLER